MAVLSAEQQGQRLHARLRASALRHVAFPDHITDRQTFRAAMSTLGMTAARIRSWAGLMPCGSCGP